MFRLSALSVDYYRLRDKMRRARRLYVLACRKAIQEEGAPALERCALRMMESGLKRSSCLSDTEYTVLRILYFIDLGLPYHNGRDRDAFGWHRWLRDNSWKHSTARGLHWIKEAA